MGVEGGAEDVTKSRGQVQDSLGLCWLLLERRYEAYDSSPLMRVVSMFRSLYT